MQLRLPHVSFAVSFVSSLSTMLDKLLRKTISLKEERKATNGEKHGEKE